jgi:hypothetical protein
MAIVKNKATARSYEQVLNHGNMSAADAIFAPTLTRHEATEYFCARARKCMNPRWRWIRLFFHLNRKSFVCFTKTCGITLTRA